MESGGVGKTERQMGGDPGSGGEIGTVVVLLGRESLTGGTGPDHRIRSPQWDRRFRSVLMCSPPSVCTLRRTQGLSLVGRRTEILRNSLTADVGI